MSATSKLGLYCKQETAGYGLWSSASPAPGFNNTGTLLEVPNFVSWDVTPDTTYTESQAITPSRQPRDQILVDTRLGGSLNLEMAYENTLIRMITTALLNDSNATVAQEETDTTYGLSQVTNALTSSDAGLHLVLNAVSGDWLVIRGFSTNEDNIIAKACQVTISGGYTAENGTLTARSGGTEGDYVEGATSGATGYLVAQDTGANTYTIKVLTGVFQAGETVREVGASGNNFTNITITSAAAVLSGYKAQTEAAGGDITVRKLSMALPGSTTRSMSFEANQSDISAGVYEVDLGCMFPQWTVTIPPKGTITTSFAIKGKERHPFTATAGSGNITEATGNPVFQCESNFYDALMGPSESELIALDSTDNSATTVCTTLTKHGLQTGDLIVVEQNADNDNNRNWLVTRVDDYSFTLQGSSAQTAQTGSNAGYFRRLKVAKAIISGDMTLDNQLRETTRAGQVGAVSQPIGTLKVSGSLDIYFESYVEQQRLKGDEYTGIALVFQEVANPMHVYVIECPRIKYTSTPATIPGGNDERVSRVQWGASREENEDVTLRFCY